MPSDRIANADIDYIGAGDTAVSGKKDGILSFRNRRNLEYNENFKIFLAFSLIYKYYF